MDTDTTLDKIRIMRGHYVGRGRPKGKAEARGMRDKIKAAAIIKKLQGHILDGEEMSISQIRAAEVLLRKILPDLSRTLVQADVNVHYVVRLPDVLDKAEWLRKYGDPAKQIEGTTNGQGSDEQLQKLQ